MSNSFLFSASDLIFIALFLSVSAGVFTGIILHLKRKGGNVRSGGFQISDALVAFMIGSYISASLVLALMAKDHAAPASPTQSSDLLKQLIPNSIFFIIIALGIASYLKFIRGMKLRETFGFDRMPPLKILGWASGLLICTFPLIGVAAYASQMALPKEDMVQQPLVMLFRDVTLNNNYRAVTEMLIATVIVAPMCEEFLFRGFFYGVMKRFLGAAPAGILTALLFASVHLNLASLASLFVLALCLTVAYERTGSLFVPMCMHALFNFANLFFIFGHAQGWFPTK